MPDPFELIAAIDQDAPAVRAALGNDAPAFFAQRDTLFNRAVDAGQADQDSIGEQVLALVRNTPAARGVLTARPAGPFGVLPGVAPPAPPPPAPPARNITVTPLNPVPPSPAQDGPPPPSQAPVPTPRPAVGAAPPLPNNNPAGSPALAVSPVAAAEAKPVPAPEQGTAPVPELPRPGSDAEGQAQRLKEWVAAGLGIVLVGSTVLMAFVVVLVQASNPAAKDVLLVLTSLSGVVLGYYFGRVPGDANAAKADAAAGQARQEAAGVRERAGELANQAEHIMDSLAGAAGSAGSTRAGADAAQTPARLQQELRDLARQARRL